MTTMTGVGSRLPQVDLGSVVAMTVAELDPVPIRYVNLGDRFVESGAPDELIEMQGLTAVAVVEAMRAALAVK